VPDWLEFILLGTAWSYVLTVLHELGHAFAAMALTEGEVLIETRAAGLLGGSVSYEPERLRRPRDELKIAAADPGVSLMMAVVLGTEWVRAGSYLDVTVLSVGALMAATQFLGSALPIRYGAGFGGPADSDGRVIWRVLTGAPPGGVERELRRITEPERAIRPAYVVLLVLAGVLGLLVWPMSVVWLAVLFGLGALLQRVYG
jgi:hypothetical protein